MKGNLLSKMLALAVILGWQISESETVRGKDQVASSAKNICPALPGTVMPEVTLTRVDGTPLQLKDAVLQKPTILIFYRGGW